MEESNTKPCPECGRELTWLADGSRPRMHKCEPKVAPVAHEAAPPGVITPDKVIASYIRTRNEISELNKQIKEMKERQDKKEEWLAKNMVANNEVGKKTLSGSCNFYTVASVKTEDWEAFRRWMQESPEDREHFLERKISKSATKQYLEDNAALPPGVGYTTIKKVKVVRP